jgi:hypothetical protein
VSRCLCGSSPCAYNAAHMLLNSEAISHNTLCLLVSPLGLVQYANATETMQVNRIYMLQEFKRQIQRRGHFERATCDCH